MCTAPRVLVVDDDKLVASSLRRALRGMMATCVYDGRTALIAATTSRFHAAIVDLRLSEVESGLDVVRRLRGRNPLLRIGLMTGMPTMKVGFDASVAGANAVFSKPIEIQSLIAWISSTPTSERPQSLEQTKRSYIENILASCNGNKSEAARRLNVRRTSLQRMLHKWG